MKKSSILILFVIVVLISVNVFAQDVPEYEAYRTITAPTIDGMLDEIWENVPVEPIAAIYNDFDDPVWDEYDFSVSFRMIWMAEVLYLYISVLDDYLVADEALATWQWDNIEVYFDGDNSDGEGQYDGINDIQLRWTYDEMYRDDGIDEGYGNAEDWEFDSESIEWVIAETDSGYNLEMEVPFLDLMIDPGLDFGLEFQIGDNDPDEGMVFYRWSAASGGAYLTTLNHGTAWLIQETIPAVLAVEDQGEPVSTFVLQQNYPNPFNPTTTITYDLQQHSPVHLQIYNTKGEHVTELVNATQAQGHYAVEFNAENLPSGIYLYQLTAGTQVISKKMLLAK